MPCRAEPHIARLPLLVSRFDQFVHQRIKGRIISANDCVRVVVVQQQLPDKLGFSGRRTRDNGFYQFADASVWHVHDGIMLKQVGCFNAAAASEATTPPRC